MHIAGGMDGGLIPDGWVKRSETTCWVSLYGFSPFDTDMIL